MIALDCGDDPAAWAALGFGVSADGRVGLGPVTVRLTGAGGGLRGWTLAGAGGPDTIDGIPTTWEDTPDPVSQVHPNGAVGLDHVVVFTDSVDRTVAALVAAGGDERRRATIRVPMAFVRVGGVIVEVAEAGGPARLWGLVPVVQDIDALGEAKPAVQPGRRILTVPARPGLETALAFMSPRI